jgi:hypothetical protein
VLVAPGPQRPVRRGAVRLDNSPAPETESAASGERDELPWLTEQTADSGGLEGR